MEHATADTSLDLFEFDTMMTWGEER